MSNYSLKQNTQLTNATIIFFWAGLPEYLTGLEPVQPVMTLIYTNLR